MPLFLVASLLVSRVVANPRRRAVPQRAAFLVQVGVDTYADPALKPLAWAGADARATSDALQRIPSHHVRRVVLADGEAAEPTWALVREGLLGRRADVDGSGSISLAEWLAYAEQRVPALASQVVAGDLPASVPMAARSSRVGASAERVVQQPRLFNYGRGGQTRIR